MTKEDFLTVLFIVLLVLIVLFLILRELVCWYFKINKQIAIDRRMNRNLEILIRGLAQSNIISQELLVELREDNIDEDNIREKQEKKEVIPGDIPEL